MNYSIQTATGSHYEENLFTAKNGRNLQNTTRSQATRRQQDYPHSTFAKGHVKR